MDKRELETLSFEDTYQRLEEIIQELEEGALSLDESVSLYEEGMQLARHCGQKLDAAELKITEVLSEMEGETDQDTV
ncbi:MAG: exodeoxyribonuclease VII small subunit [Chloroflexota bacterium]|nr:exodeoxyribonuclease VII small subunit [Chloroflexota bacterium]